MATPADRQVEAQEGLQRLARAIWKAECTARSQETMDATVCPPFESLTPRKQGFYMRMAELLLGAGVIRALVPVRRENPLDGQTSIMDEPSLM